jgi:hypothetical protein
LFQKYLVIILYLLKLLIWIVFINLFVEHFHFNPRLLNSFIFRFFLFLVSSMCALTAIIQINLLAKQPYHSIPFLSNPFHFSSSQFQFFIILFKYLSFILTLCLLFILKSKLIVNFKFVYLHFLVNFYYHFLFIQFIISNFFVFLIHF